MMQNLTKEDIKQMDKEMVEWVKKGLNSPYGHWLYNVLLSLKDLYEELPKNIEGVKERK